MCNINITSQKFRFPIFPFCFLLFIFSFFFLFFLFFPFSFPVFLLSFLLHAQAIHGRIRGRRSLHARVPVITELQVLAPPLAHDPRASLSLSRVVFTGQPEVCVKRTPEEQQPAVNPCGARHSDSISASLLASRARPSHRPIAAVRFLHASHARSRASLSARIQMQAEIFSTARAEPK